MSVRKARWIVFLGSFLALFCSADPGAAASKKPPIPHGYMKRLQLEWNGGILLFGPFVGYYFKPVQGGDLSSLRFVCYNERSFYTSDLPPDTLLYEGDAVLVQLPDAGRRPPAGNARIIPVFFDDVPTAWLTTRPQPIDEFVHFHSTYNAGGATRVGYWFRHRAVESFTYDMGGRVGTESVLYHEVVPGPDADFARIVEFDHGPGSQSRDDMWAR